jgi:hypothetical protein
VKLTAMVWTTVCGLLASADVAAAAPASAAPDAPLKLAHSYALPADIKGHFGASGRSLMLSAGAIPASVRGMSRPTENRALDSWR